MNTETIGAVEEPLIYRARELEKKLGLSRNAIDRLVTTGELKPPILLGARSKGFLASDVQAFLATRAAMRDASAHPSRPCVRDAA